MDSLQKIIVPDNDNYIEDGMDDEQKFQRIVSDLNAKKGCRMKGSFDIDRVPGNFHFSCHAYGALIPRLVNQGHSKY